MLAVIGPLTDRDSQHTPAPAAAAPEAARAPLTSAQQVLALQRTAGNAAVTRLLARDDVAGPYQLTPPTLFGRPRQTGVLGDMQLHLDPEFQMRALDVQLQPDALRDLLSQIPPPPAAPPTPAPAPAPPATPGPSVRPPGPFDVSPTEHGQFGDVITALSAVPEINRLSEAVRQQLWTRLPTADKWTLGVSGATIALAGLGGVLASPSGRQTLAGLSGRPISIPGVPWFSPEFNVQGPNLIIGLHVDVGAFLQGRGGFGPAQRGPTPLTPQPPDR